MPGPSTDAKAKDERDAHASAAAGRRRHDHRSVAPIDYPLLAAVSLLLGAGLLMVASASMPIAARTYGDPFFFLLRHGFALVLALGGGLFSFAIPPRVWERTGPWLFLLGIGFLILVLLPGVGRTVNGATRWIPLGVLNLQPSELMKLFAVIYIAGYLVRRHQEVTGSLFGFLRPMVLIGAAGALIMAEPDFGTTAVLLATVMGLLFLGGVNMWTFAALFALVSAGLGLLIWIEPYRWDRIISFLDPFADPFNSGYQLSQALIAFGRGEWLGVGFGNGIQKQFFLPEAHTDFLLAVVGEELGLVGVLAFVALFGFVVWRIFAIGGHAWRRNDPFGAYVAHGIGLLLGLQAFINAGVNTGLLPTKGLTLPFVSYGSNAIIVSVMAIGLLLRIDYELRRRPADELPQGGLRWVHA
jgi:cell division protein FtsW